MGIQRGWFHTGLGKGLSIFLFPSYIVAPTDGLLAVPVISSRYLSPDEE